MAIFSFRRYFFHFFFSLNRALTFPHQTDHRNPVNRIILFDISGMNDLIYFAPATKIFLFHRFTLLDLSIMHACNLHLVRFPLAFFFRTF